MIDRNIGTAERVLRLLAAVLLLAWVIGEPRFGLLPALALLAAFALLWNSLFARCYLWKWLGLSSCRGSCETGGSDGGEAREG